MSLRSSLLRSACRPAIFSALSATSLAAATLTREDLLAATQAPLAAGRLQAVSLAVVRVDGVVSAHAGSLAPDVPAVPDDRTLYEIGSLSKVFTGLLLADAVVRGAVTLDQPIATLLPPDVTLPDEAGSRVTLRMLATHTSGLPRIPVEIPSDDYRDPYARYGETELWATLRRVKLDFAPGAKASYSNLAVGLLGTLLARQAGTTYAALLAERITGPLGMVDTVIAIDAARRPRFAPPFDSSGRRWTPWEFQALAGAGGIRSTLADLTRFATVMLRPGDSPLREAIELAWAKQPVAGGAAPGGMGLGWMFAGDGRTRWHNGMTGGFHSALFVSRDVGAATVVLANRSTPAGSEIAELLLRRVAGMPDRPIPNRDRRDITLTAAQLDRCVGTFRLSAEFVLVFERRDGVLVLTPTGQPTDRLYAATPDTFFSRLVAADLVFEFPADGAPATAVTLKQNGRSFRGARENP